MPSRNSSVVVLYKTLLHLGRDYPLGYDYFRRKCHAAFMKNKNENNAETIEKLIGHGEYVVKELEALYMLKKYRTLKRNYYNEQSIDHYSETLSKVESSCK